MEKHDLDRIFARKLFRIFLIIVSSYAALMSTLNFVRGCALSYDVQRSIDRTTELRENTIKRFFLGDQYLTVDTELEE